MNATPAAPHRLLRSLRAGLRMTQSQLARRAGLPQSHVAKIEAGRGDPQLGTWRRLFAALSCEVDLVARPAASPEKTLAERAKEKARQNVARAAGTMALERELPDDAAIRALVRKEEARLLSRPSSELWED